MWSPCDCLGTASCCWVVWSFCSVLCIASMTCRSVMQRCVVCLCHGQHIQTYVCMCIRHMPVLSGLFAFRVCESGVMYVHVVQVCTCVQCSMEWTNQRVLLLLLPLEVDTASQGCLMFSSSRLYFGMLCNVYRIPKYGH